jgi:hypothetical protein
LRLNEAFYTPIVLCGKAVSPFRGSRTKVMLPPSLKPPKTRAAPQDHAVSSVPTPDWPQGRARGVGLTTRMRDAIPAPQRKQSFGHTPGIAPCGWRLSIVRSARRPMRAIVLRRDRAAGFGGAVESPPGRRRVRAEIKFPNWPREIRSKSLLPM